MEADTETIISLKNYKIYEIHSLQNEKLSNPIS